MTYSNTPFKRKTVKHYIWLTLTVFAVCIICKLFFVDGYRILIVASSSMEPNFHINSVVVIKEASFENLEIDDVVVYSATALNGKMAMHRIVRIEGNGIYTKGDNNKHEDNQLITKTDYVGKCIFKTDILVHIISIFSSPLAILIYLILPAIAGCLILFGVKTFRTRGQEIR